MVYACEWCWDGYVLCERTHVVWVLGRVTSVHMPPFSTLKAYVMLVMSPLSACLCVLWVFVLYLCVCCISEHFDRSFWRRHVYVAKRIQGKHKEIPDPIWTQQCVWCYFSDLAKCANTHLQHCTLHNTTVTICFDRKPFIQKLSCFTIIIFVFRVVCMCLFVILSQSFPNKINIL